VTRPDPALNPGPNDPLTRDPVPSLLVGSITIPRRTKENIDAVGTIIDCVRFLAKQGLAFRGHDECSASNRGNFFELVHFLATTTTTLVRYSTHPGNASYLSPDIQNQLIKVLYETTVDVIKTEAADAQYFGIEADKVSDTGKEFISIILRYVSGYKI